ncbi:peptidase U32 [Methanoplanus sp. FWC-SCC4]|uniref:Peptidase U32 n=1 Tax=Methanochimaera problematica TaxID=2609417 RepID=A0AA97I2R3_9EURY|nr:U32 family peptidase [Methanoplanus sp. FWC-SCC4]WOF16560.1 peptidase U32 [Methanoplanus sp. FWC-SCC4]
MTIKKRTELLAPAGSKEALFAAISAGADAVYLSGRKFGARRFAKNFDHDELKEAVRYCHSRGVRVYVTHNTLIHDNEMEDALKELLFFYTIGVDAVLVQDLGLLSAGLKCIPDLELHASTQMTVHNREGLEWSCKKGISRVVLAREVSLDEIYQIHDPKSECLPEIEVFVHGALCYSYSGQCFLSSFLGGRSGNRGMCAQPCRKKYSLLSGFPDNYGRIGRYQRLKTKGQYLLSPRDLCTYPFLKDILAAPVDSLKIEGRMKSPAYVALVVSVYRKAMDKILEGSGSWSASEDDINTLLFAFNRLFTGGYLTGDFGSSLMAQDRPDNRGVYSGSILSYDNKTGRASMKLEGRVKPLAGDGMVVFNKKSSREEGFVLHPPYSVRDGILYFKTSSRLSAGDLVNITRREELSSLAEIICSADGGIYKKIPVHVEFFLEGNVPVVKGRTEIHGKSLSFMIHAGFEMSEAIKKPVTKANLEKIFGKTGGTQFTAGSFSAEYDENLFAPQGLLNNLRREFYTKAQECLINSYIPLEERIKYCSDSVFAMLNNAKMNVSEVSKTNYKPEISFYSDTPESVKGALEGGCTRICYEEDADFSDPSVREKFLCRLSELSEMCKQYDAEFIWKWPHITPQSFLEDAKPMIEKAVSAGISGIMTEGAGAGYAVKKTCPSLKVYGAAGLNIFNSLAFEILDDIFSSVTLSQELSFDEIRTLLDKKSPDNQVETELMVHGAVELMVTENNLTATSLSGFPKKPKGESFAITDEKSRNFPVYVDKSGRTHIYNSVETCLVDLIPDILKTGIDVISIDGRRKGFEYAKKVSGAYKTAVDISVNEDPRLWATLEELKKDLEKISAGGITTGHFREGV